MFMKSTLGSGRRKPRFGGGLGWEQHGRLDKPEDGRTVSGTGQGSRPHRSRH
jgi:hypothetical protein